ncbi:hypothetical protein PRIC2_002006 [Phytophthora ramorum]
MAALPRLRDPTLEELYTAPARALPDEIQQMPAEDTACTFCGVSYFVFAEVQTLQTTVKQYKKTFREFVQFMERERSVARDLRQQVTELKDDFVQQAATCSTSIRQLAEQNEMHRSERQAALELLEQVQKELLVSGDASRELQILSKRSEEELKLAHSLVEQKLRDEVLHASSQAESCKLMSESQEASFKEQQQQDQQRIRELESRFVESQTHWAVAERQLVTERDVLKQKLLATSERVEQEATTARQLEVQLTAIREELARVVTASDAERKSNSQSNSEVIQLKHQLQTLEKGRAQLLSENGRFKDDKYKYEDELKALRLRMDQLRGQLSVSTSSTEKVKGDYVRDLETLRGEHGIEIGRLQRDHARAIEELKTSQNNYQEYLQKETTELQTRSEEASRQAIGAINERLQDAERRANEWKDRALQNASEREEAKRKCTNFESILQEWKARLASSEHDKQKMVGEAEATRAVLEKKLASALHEAGNSRHEEEQRRKHLQDENADLQQQLQNVQAQMEHRREQPTPASEPQVAWQTKQNDGRKPSREESTNQESHGTERIIDQLRQTLKQKDREIALLQQTVHRECMERTSLMERMRSGKVVPEMGIAAMPVSFGHNEQASVMRSSTSSSLEDISERTEDMDLATAEDQQPKASFYEKLRRGGSRKAKPRK